MAEMLEYAAPPRRGWTWWGVVLVALTIVGPLMTVVWLGVGWGGVESARGLSERRDWASAPWLPARVEPGDLSEAHREWLAGTIADNAALSDSARLWLIEAFDQVPLPITDKELAAVDAGQFHIQPEPGNPAEPNLVTGVTLQFDAGEIRWLRRPGDMHGSLLASDLAANQFTSYLVFVEPVMEPDRIGHRRLVHFDAHLKPPVWEVALACGLAAAGLLGSFAWLAVAWAALETWAGQPFGSRRLRRFGWVLITSGMLLGGLLAGAKLAGTANGLVMSVMLNDDSVVMLTIIAASAVAVGVLTRPVAERAGRASGVGT
jgi:hypothetical protein